MLRSGGAGEVCLGIRELRPQGNNFATNRTATGAGGGDASSSVTWGNGVRRWLKRIKSRAL